MAAATLQERTQEILERYRTKRDQLAIDSGGDSFAPEHLTQFEVLARETIRMLRENKTKCVREESAAAERIVGSSAVDAKIDLGYSEAKAEIDRAIEDVLVEKSKHRAPQQVDDKETDTLADKRLQSLTELHESGVLDAKAFEAAKARLE